MSQPIISVENLSKSYLIGHQGPREAYTSLRDTIGNHAKNFARRTADTLRGKQMLQGDSVEEFWALKDVSFEVKQGEVLGIIGRNGAGKSTLLKVLSRITEPTQGRVTLRGRVASLLEVGTGFHPELSGRENIFLNGAVLGMSRREIKSKFDEIVDFAGVEKFLDTPVKRYSSGMYVRLAFAVAAHLEPEILVVDEVLAVGDAEFQKKCMGKMKDVAGEGRTVLFVSHNMAAITTLTQTSVFLSAGQLVYKGKTEESIKHYLSSGQSSLDEYVAASPAEIPHLERLKILTKSQSSTHRSGSDLIVEATIAHQKPRTGLCFAFTINNYNQQKIAHFSIYDPDTSICRTGSSTVLRCNIPNLALNVGNYTLSAYLADPPGGKVHDVQEFICPFDVEIIGRQTLFGWKQESGSVLMDSSWSHEPDKGGRASPINTLDYEKRQK